MSRGEAVLGLTEFGRDYADVYDSIYRSKGYDGEVDLIERILIRYNFAGSRQLLDLGCGTGAHAVRLAQRGHRIVGVDRSPDMLAQARAKAAVESGLRLDFHEADICKLDLHQEFDAALMMFTVLGYLLTDSDLNGALASVRRHLASGALFIFDVWHGPAVLADRPTERNISVAHGSARINRKTRAALDISRHVCRVNFELERVTDDGRAEQWQEEHFVRFYFREELESALKQNHLELLDLRRFPDGEGPADEHSWNVIGVARAR
jgi:SAM-dependent methyltransferase